MTASLLHHFLVFEWIGHQVVIDQSLYTVLVGNIKVTDHVFVDDAVLLMESVKALVMAHKLLHEEVKSLELKLF